MTETGLLALLVELVVACTITPLYLRPLISRWKMRRKLLV